MKYMMIACVASLAILGCGAEDSAVRTDKAARPEKWAVPMTLAGVPNLHKVEDGLYRSAQPTAEGMTNLVRERTFQVDRSSAWQQFFLSASPTNAAAWNLQNARLEWETDTGSSGFASSSPNGDSFRIPLATDDLPHLLTLRIRATGTSTVLSPTPLHLGAYAPEFRIEGGVELTDEGGGRLFVFLDGTDSQIWLAIDHSHRPCRAPVGPDECDFEPFDNLWMSNDDFWFSVYDPTIPQVDEAARVILRHISGV